jgi:DNA-binding MarR family transcriptional regulator
LLIRYRSRGEVHFPRIALPARGSPHTPLARWWEQWNQLVTAGLAHQNPLAVLRLLELTSVPNGIFQMELHSAMRIRQSRLAKLIRKLKDAGWISVSAPRPATSGRCLVKTSPRGQEVLAAFSPPSRHPARKRPTLHTRPRLPTFQTGQQSFDLHPKKNPA